MPKENQPQDFGEKIGGARKDLWNSRGLLPDDLYHMNEREAEKYVTKNHIWKKPDYEAMIAGGMPADVAYAIKLMRDGLLPKPKYMRGDNTPEKRQARQQQYIDTVLLVKDIAYKIKTRVDVMAAFKRLFLDNGLLMRRDGLGYDYQFTSKAFENPTITSKLVESMYYPNDRFYERKVVQPARKKQFGIPKAQKLPNGFGIKFYDGTGYSKGNDWQPNTYYVTKGHAILKTNLESEETSLKWAQEYAKQQNASKLKRFVPEQLTRMCRNGPDYVHGRNIQGEDYLAIFGFRGGEFGNWISAKDRQASLNMGFDALKDLAAALGIADRDISLNGILAIAFGSRGQGNAVAHYEPLRQVINLTKLRGAGSLAHEWWHALDDFIGQQTGAGGLLTENPGKHPLFKKLVDTMKYKLETHEQAAQRVRMQPTRIKTNYHINSIKMGEIHTKDGGYWDSNAEMSARAFATYIMDKLSYRSDYLIGHAENAVGFLIDRDGNPQQVEAFPQREERAAINTVFDEIVAELKRERVFRNDDINITKHRQYKEPVR